MRLPGQNWNKKRIIATLGLIASLISIISFITGIASLDQLLEKVKAIPIADTDWEFNNRESERSISETDLPRANDIQNRSNDIQIRETPNRVDKAVVTDPIQGIEPVAAQDIEPQNHSNDIQIRETPNRVDKAVVTDPIQGIEPVAAQDIEPAANSAPQRSAACQKAVRIIEFVPAGVRLVGLTCSASGEYGLEGTSASEQSLRAFRDRLQQIPSQVSLSSWREGRASTQILRFAFQGHFDQMPARELATLSEDQAARLFGKIAHWADESGLDGLSIKKTIDTPLPPARVHQRQKLWGTGSYQQIGAFLQKLQQIDEIVTLGEVVLMPFWAGERGWAEARLYAAVDVVVGLP